MASQNMSKPQRDYRWLLGGRKNSQHLRNRVDESPMKERCEMCDRVPHSPRHRCSSCRKLDGQFQKAGFPPEHVAECHGTIHSLQCLEPCVNSAWPAQGFEPEISEATGRLINDMPVCPRCGKLARPNILMFGNWSWVEKRAPTPCRRRAGGRKVLADCPPFQ
jgi:hypothetical protein